MVVAWSQWIFSAGVLLLGCLQVSMCLLLSKADQVYVDRQQCPGMIDAGTLSGNWKRVLFSDAGNTCSGTFHCKLKFVVKDGSASGNSLCVDYSQMRLFGKNSKLQLSSSKFYSKTVTLSRRRYPQKQPRMDSRLCVLTRNSLFLEFSSRCNKPLDELFQGWMNVYMKFTVSERIYFVDGNCSYSHRMSHASREKVTLRSHVWNVPDFGGPQNCKFQVSFSYERPRRVCIDWTHLLGVDFPEDINVRIKKTYFSIDKAFTSENVIRKSNLISLISVYSEHKKCYLMQYDEGFVLEVSRTANATDNVASQNGLLLLEVILTMEDEDRTTTTISVDTTTLTSEEPGPDIMKIILGVLGGVVAIFLCFGCRRSFWQSSSSDKGSVDGSEDSQSLDHRYSIACSEHDARNEDTTSSYPMLAPVTLYGERDSGNEDTTSSNPVPAPVTPSAPALSQEDQLEVNIIASYDPVIYPADPPDISTSDVLPPPTYESLFPDRNTKHV